MLVMLNGWEFWTLETSVIAVALHLQRPRNAGASASAAAAAAAHVTKTRWQPEAGANAPVDVACPPRKMNNSPWQCQSFQVPVLQTWSVPTSAPKSASRMGVAAPAVQDAENSLKYSQNSENSLQHA